jgi:hypothetical protein
MLERFEQRNREMREGHPRILRDATHVLGGSGVGLLLYPALRREAGTLGCALILRSAAVHLYADAGKPSAGGISQRA